MHDLAEKLKPLECPHPYGTREYFDWWEMQHQIAIEQWRQESALRTKGLAMLRSVKHGHDFGYCGVCACGLDEREYHAELPSHMPMHVCRLRAKN